MYVAAPSIAASASAAAAAPTSGNGAPSASTPRSASALASEAGARQWWLAYPHGDALFGGRLPAPMEALTQVPAVKALGDEQERDLCHPRSPRPTLRAPLDQLQLGATKRHPRHANYLLNFNQCCTTSRSNKHQHKYSGILGCIGENCIPNFLEQST